ncbi:MAG: exopolyphosphatase [Ekhidna sp.]|nr:exopolyphosphatase [Ekhidna sp.]
MKVAVIDLGTNTFHFMEAEVSAAAYSILYKERVPVKIGEKGINKDEITPEAWGRAVAVLKEFKKKIDQSAINQVYGTATSAIRNAKNGKAFVREIKKITGIEIEIISGKREALLIHLGVSKAMDLGEEKSLIMDIGGGSIEFIIADKHRAYWMHSFEIGGQRLVEKFHDSDPITENEINNLHHFFDEQLALLFEAYQIHQPSTLIGCSGTFDTLNDIYCEANKIPGDANLTELPFNIDAFNAIFRELITKSRQQRLEIPGMVEMRVDMIVTACILINYVIEKFSLSSLRVSTYALKEGILFNALAAIQKGKFFSV